MMKNAFNFNNLTDALKQALKQLRLSRVAITLAASLILLVSTACSSDKTSASTVSGSGSQMAGPKVTGTGSYTEGRKNPTELYRTTQPKEGGMNQYSDTDPRQTDKRLGVETKARVDQAKGNLKKTQDTGDVVEQYREGTPLDERTKNIVEPAGNALENLTKDVKEGTERGIKNLQRNTENAKQTVQETLNDAQDNAADLSRDSSRGVKQTADRVKSTLDNVGQDLGDKASNLVDGATRQTNARGAGIKDLQSGAQRTPRLDNEDLAERAKDTFGTAARNLGEFATDAANDNR